MVACASAAAATDVLLCYELGIYRTLRLLVNIVIRLTAQRPGSAGRKAMNTQHHAAVSTTLLALLAAALLSCCSRQPQSGQVLDEARTAARSAASFPHAGEDYFHDMDN